MSILTKKIDTQKKLRRPKMLVGKPGLDGHSMVPSKLQLELGYWN